MEIENFGYNIMTVGFIGASVLSGVIIWGLYKQNQKIWHSKSAESISVLYFSYAFFSVINGIVYGLAADSLLIIATNSIYFFLYCGIFSGLYKFRGFSNQEKLFSLAYLAGIALMIFSEKKDLLLVIYCFGGYASMMKQIYEVIKNKSAGQLEVRLFMIYWVSVTFWIMYSYGIRNYTYLGLCMTNFTLLTISIILMIKYPAPKMQEAI